MSTQTYFRGEVSARLRSSFYQRIHSTFFYPKLSILLCFVLLGVGAAFGQISPNEKAVVQTSLGRNEKDSKARRFDHQNDNRSNDTIVSLWKNEPFGNRDISKELVERRSANEKHFQRADGQVDMLVSSDPINYFESGVWNTIYNTIREESNDQYKFSNYHNVFKSYYAGNIQDGFKTRINNQEIFEMLSASMYYEKNGEKRYQQPISASFGKADQNTLTYSRVYGDLIDLKITQSGGKRKLDYIIKSKNALHSQFSDADYLVFSEEIVLPDGWSAKLENGVVLLIDRTGKLASMYEMPVIFDSNHSVPNKAKEQRAKIDLTSYSVEKSRIKNDNNSEILAHENILYEISVNGSTLTILTKVRMSYLLDERRVFPVVVDPTLTANSAPSGWWYSNGGGPAGVTTTGAPAGSSITNVNIVFNSIAVQYYISWFWGWSGSYSNNCFAWHAFGLDDGISGFYTCGGDLNGWNCQDPNKTWYSRIFSWDGDSYRGGWGAVVTVTYETVSVPTSITGTTTICAGSSTTLTAAGGTANAGSTPITTQWFTGSCGGTLVGTGTSISVTPSTTTTYFVRRVGQCSTTGCASVTVNVNPQNTIAAGQNRTVCQGSAMTAISLATTGATGATITGLPAGVTGSWAGNVVTISGTPTASGTFNYTVTTTGGCPPATTTGTITVNPQNTISVGQNRTVCQGSAMTTISLATTGATGATVTGLPAGVTGTWAGNVVTISGTPTASGTFNYTVTTTGGCPPATTTGTITVNPQNTISVGQNRTVCQGSAMTAISLATTGATGATITGLPTGVTGSWAGNVVTISGTPTVSGTFNYTVTTTGGCPPATTTGTVTVTSPSVAPTSITGTTTLCSGGSTTLTLSGGSPGSGATAQWFSGSCGGTLIGTGNSITVAPTTSTPYFVRYSGTCNTTSCASVTVTVNTPSTAPSAITGTPATICHGQSVTLGVSGGSLVGTSQWQWFSGSCGGTPVGVGPSITVTPSATTTYFVQASGNGACPPTACASGTITLPTAGTALSNNNESATCTVNQNGWIHFYHSSGRLIASINSQGQNLGNVVVTSYVDPVNAIVPACDDPSLETAVLQRHWVITPSNQPTSNVLVRLPFRDAEYTTLGAAASGTANPADDVGGVPNFKLSRYHGPANVNANALDNCTNSGGSANTVIHSPADHGSTTGYSGVNGENYCDYSIPQFSEFWLHFQSDNSPLPVELIAFQGNCTDEGVHLTWQTASESNNDYFVVQRSRDGIDWNDLGTVAGNGNSMQAITYDFVDANGDGGYYYRLVQVDFNGDRHTKYPVFVDCASQSTTLGLYPNPTKDDFTLEVHAQQADDTVQISLVDVTGKLIGQRTVSVAAGVNTFHFADKLESGTYLVRVHMKTEVKSLKLVVRN